MRFEGLKVFARPGRALACIGWLLIVMPLSGAAMVVWLRYQDERGDGERETVNLALTVSAETDLIFRCADLVLGMLAEAVQAAAAADPPGDVARLGSDALHGKVRDWRAGLPLVDGFAAVGPDDRLVNSTWRWPVPAKNVSNRDCFLALRDTPGLVRHVGKPVLHRATGGPSLVLARRSSAASPAWSPRQACPISA